MSRAVPKEQKKFDTNSESLLEMIQKGIHEEQTDIIVSWAEIKITYLVNWSIITRIVSNSEDDGSFSIEMEFYGCLRIGSYLRDP